MGIEVRGNVNPQMSDIASLRLQNIAAKSSTQFAGLLKKSIESRDEIHFSKHAAMRIEQRGISINDSFVEKLKEALNQASDKGARNIAVISSNGAFILNVPNRTVVTGITEDEMKNNMFTNIDAAMVL